MPTPFLEKAEENLKVAEWCYESGYMNACVNRTYYSMFQSALASLIHYGYATSEGANTHEWVQAEFAKKLVRQKKCYPGFQGYLMQAQEVRNQADYQEQMVSKKRAQRILRKARQFFNTIDEDLK